MALTDLVYVEVIEERNWEEVARYTNSGPESDQCSVLHCPSGPNTCLVVFSFPISVYHKKNKRNKGKESEGGLLWNREKRGHKT